MCALLSEKVQPDANCQTYFTARKLAPQMYTRLLVIATALLLERRARLAAGLATDAGVTQGRRGDTSKALANAGDANNQHKTKHVKVRKRRDWR